MLSAVDRIRSSYRNIFTTETQEHLDGLSSLLMRLEQAPQADWKGILDELFRHAHSVKGAAGMMGFDGTAAMAHQLEDWLQSEGFTKEVTPTIISRKMLADMTIDEEHKLFEQVFWLDGKKCLRPMLAPNLYVVMRELHRVTSEPVKIYEIGSCFRKESQGAQHMSEFTMLNCVELAYVEEGGQLEELKRLAHRSMEVLGIPESEYELVVEESTVYGHTVDIEVNGMEVASGSYGPHFLDAKWGVFDTWVGIGFGIERLTMALEKSRTIKRYGKSITFIDGQPLNI